MATVPLLAPGDVVGRFRVLRPLGVGASGEVHLAVGIDDGREVAIKAVATGGQDAAARCDAFDREVDLYRTVAHPNVVNYLGHGDAAGCRYVALEYITGVSLRRVLARRGPPDPITAFSWAQELVMALHAAHQRGIIHRDVKPENIMTTSEGRVKLIDFGIARSRTTEEDAEEDAFRGGAATAVTSCTPAYASPEQLLGRPVDFRTDVWSAGLVIFELFAGRPLVADASSPRSVLLEHMAIEAGRAVTLPSTVESRLRGGLEELLGSMLRFDPDRRCRSTDELTARLEALAAATGGGYLAASRSPDKVLARRELVDTHVWNGMNLLHERRIVEAVAELSRVAVFAGFLGGAAVDTLLGELDVILLGHGGLPPEHAGELLGKVGDLHAVLCDEYELAVRERQVVLRAQDLLEPSAYERFLEVRAVEGRRAYPVGAAWVRLLHRTRPDLARPVWVRFHQDLVRRELLLEADLEKRAVEERFGGRALDADAVAEQARLVGRWERERSVVRGAAAWMERGRRFGDLATVCRTFLVEYPRDLEVLAILERCQRAMELRTQATVTRLNAALVLVQMERWEQARKALGEVLEDLPRSGVAVTALWYVLRRGGVLGSRLPAERRALATAICEAGEAFGPLLADLEADAADGDESVLERCAELAVRAGLGARAAGYLVDRAACLAARGDAPGARRCLDRAAEQDRVVTSRRCVGAAWARACLPPLEFSRLVGAAAAGSDDASLAELRAKSVRES